MYFTEEHDLFREGFRSFLQKEVAPNIDKWEKTGKIDRFIWEKFGEMGYFGINYPEAYGGLGLDLFYTVIFLEELQRINSGGFAAAYILNGSKIFITNGVYSDYLVVIAKTNPELKHKGMSVFLVDRNTPGVSANKLDKLGWRASDTGDIAFDNVEIPVENLMGEEGKGFGYVMQHLALERLIMGINAHARAEYALEYAKQYMTERTAFGKQLKDFQVLRHKIAKMESQVEMHKVFNYHITQLLNKGEYAVREATMSKLNATKMADDVIYECLQMLGGYG